LTKRKTLVLESNYRPCVLNKHFIAFDDTYANQKRKRYADMEMARMHAAMSIIQKYPNDQFLVFTGNKNWGKQFAPILQSRGFNCDFHNADLSPDRRRQLELDFNNGKINVLIASSTLSWGVNVNARRVILAHTSYGMTEMEVADIEQVCGRAGRVKYHNEGDAYILVQRSKEQLEIARISEGFEVKSRLNDINTLIFHVVNEVNNGNIYDAKSLLEWYERSLAAVQEDRLTIENATRVLEFLERKNMIRTNEETGRYEVTQLGVVSSLMYMHPLDVYDWYRNFSDLEKIGISKTLDGSNKNEVATNDLKVCLALADINKNKNGDAFISSAERETDAVVDFCNRTGKPASAVTKAASVYYAMLNDKEVDDPLRSLHFGIVNDLPRVIGTLKAIHQRYGSPQAKNSTNICGWKYNAIEWDVLFTRLKYGVPRYLTPLASLPEIGKVLAKKLFENGVTSKSDVQSKRSLVESLIGSKRAKKLYDKLDKKV
jgi:replicative superfamily II helicase